MILTNTECVKETKSSPLDFLSLIDFFPKNSIFIKRYPFLNFFVWKKRLASFKGLFVFFGTMRRFFERRFFRMVSCSEEESQVYPSGYFLAL